MNYFKLKMKDLHRIKNERGIKISYPIKKKDLIRMLWNDNDRKGLDESQQLEEYNSLIREDKEKEIKEKEAEERFRKKMEKKRLEEKSLENPYSKRKRELERSKIMEKERKLRIENRKRLDEESKLIKAYIEAGWTVGRLGGRDRGLMKD